MNKSESINELASALAKAQGAMLAAKMDSVNPFLKNKYADLGSVIQAARQPLSTNGLSFTQHPAVHENAVTVTTTLMHSSGQWLESEITLPLDGGKGLSLAQSMGAIITYLRRYTLSAVLGIYADEDTDGNNHQTAPKPPAQPARPAAPAGSQIDPAQDAPRKGAAEVDAAIYESACNRMTQEKTPRKYGDVPTANLSYMLNSIATKKAAGGYTSEELATAEAKAADIQVILNWRHSHGIA